MLEIARLRDGDIVEIAAAFAALGWNKPASQYEAYLREQAAGERLVLVAREDGSFAGYVTLHLDDAQRPDIQDLNVLPRYRKRGIGSALLTAVEAAAAQTSSRVTIAVGLTADYGAAQRLYVARGYLPDGHGISRAGRPILHGEVTSVDDDLVLTLSRGLPAATSAGSAPSPPR